MRLIDAMLIMGLSTSASAFLAGVVTDNPNRYLNIPCGFILGALTGAVLYLVVTWLYGKGE